MHSSFLPLAAAAVALASSAHPASASSTHDPLPPKHAVHRFRDKRMYDIRADNGVVNLECVGPLPLSPLGSLSRRGLSPSCSTSLT